MRISDWSSDLCSSDPFLKLPRSMLTDSSPKAAAVDAANPLLVEVTRGSQVESRHRAAVAVVDTDGKLVVSAGDTDRPVYARSAIKSLQAIALVESGGADAFELSEAELALARSEEHTSELQSLMRISYAAFCLKKKMTLQQ